MKRTAILFLMLAACSSISCSDETSGEARSETFSTSLFDCTSTKKLPQRRSPVPLNCVIDPECDRSPMVVAHRGSGGEGGVIAPENSLSALRAAVWMGIDGSEIDVRHTADDRLVLMHDGGMERTTGVKAEVASQSFAEITATPLLAPSNRYEGNFSCERVPSFEDALEIARDRLIITLDTKTDRVDLVVRAIEAAGMIDQIMISVADADRAVRARALNPGVHVQVRPDTEDEIRQHLALFDRHPEIFEIPWSLGVQARSLVGTDAKLFSDIFTEDAVTVVRDKQGSRDTSHYSPIFESGIQIVQTEFPAILLQHLERWPFKSDPWQFLP